MINGDKAKVSKSNFQEIVLEFIKEQKEFNKKQNEFNKRIESDVKLLKSFHKNEI